MHAELNGNVEVITILFGEVGEERNRKVGKICSVMEKWRAEQSLMAEEEAVVQNC